jgi:uncharacterized protein DUF4331
MTDHFSGPRAIAGPEGDICDLFAFPSPERPGRLVLAMNILPNAGPSAFFSDAIVCRFRLRPLTIAARGSAAAFTFGSVEQELVFDVTFDAPRRQNGDAASVQMGRCIPPSGEPVAFTVHDDRGGHVDGLRAFAGLRSDPFFIDLMGFTETINTGRVAFRAVGSNFSHGQNILSVVVEADCAPLLQAGGPLFAVVGETVVAGKLPIRIERVGRPEIKNLILQWKQYDQVNRDMELRDIYNLEDTFHMGKDYRAAYRARLNANLPIFDGFDGKADWRPDAQGNHPLTELLLADYLAVDVSKPYAEDSFFEIEQALLHGETHATCGGRSLNDDVMDTLATVLINAGNGPRIRDGVDQATQPAARTFPYLAPPNPPTMATPPDLPPAPMTKGDEQHGNYDHYDHHEHHDH